MARKKELEFSKRQMQIMELMWDNGGSMTASEIVKRDKKFGLQSNTVQAALRSLLAKGYIKVSEIVYSGTSLCRSYAPTITREEYTEQFCRNTMMNTPAFQILATVIAAENNLEQLSAMEKMISVRREALRLKK